MWMWLFEKTNGWKSVIGYVVTKLTALIVARYPDTPVEPLVVILNYLGEALLAFGLAHKATKEIKK